MAALTILPHETLVEIFSNLSCPDIASMARVSRHFKLISEPLLYTSPCLGKTSNTTGAGSICPSLVILLRTLLTPGRGILASHVRFLRLLSDDVGGDQASHYSRDTITRIVFMASKFGIHEPLDSQAALMIVLLDLLPHLEILQIAHPGILSSFARMLKFNITTITLPCGLQSLREFHSCLPRFISQIDSQIGSHPLLLFMELPRIRIIDVPGISMYADPLGFNAAAASSAVTHMRFSWPNISHSVLSLVLLIPIALTHFSYTALTGSGFDVPEFVAAITPLRVSLRSLHLDFSDVALMTGYDDDDDDDEEFQKPHYEVSLRDWPLLQTLSCSLMPLLQLYDSPRLMNLLPVGLRELEVLRSSDWLIDEEAEHILEMLGQKQWAVPRLEKLVVDPKWGGGEDVLHTLKVACETAGVRFVEESVGGGW